MHVFESFYFVSRPGVTASWQDPNSMSKYHNANVEERKILRENDAIVQPIKTVHLNPPFACSMSLSLTCALVD